ncbi:MAG TPA: sulfur carrier protein ThiS [Mycobacteriales bacterium]|nr:sulfur carrier protein ThiS [Mycobacteriales bacterium]
MSAVTVNGAGRELPPGTTVSDIVGSLTVSPEGCAVAVNESVVPRSDWPAYVVEPGDRVEVLTAVQGG